MIKLKQLLEGRDYSEHSAILTSNPPKLFFAKYHEGSHVELLSRVFPEVLELANEFEKSGYGADDEDGGNDALYAAANAFCSKNNIARIVIENGKLIFNTDRHQPLTNSQMRFIKDYCIENGLELVWSIGMKSQSIDLMEKK